MEKINLIKGWIILWMGICLLGCATTRDIQIVFGEIDRTNSQLNLIQKEITSLQVELGALKGDLGNQTKNLQADLLLRIENLQSEIRTLSTDVEEYKVFIKRPSKEMDHGKEDSELRLKALEEKGKTFEEKINILEERIKELEGHPKGFHGKTDWFSSKQMEMEKSIPTKEPLTEGKGISIGAGDLYKDAYETFQKGNLEAARRKFETFLKQYPNTELSDNAQFWIGETFFLKKDFEKAILEYEKAIAKYPEGDKIAAALFKQALSFLELGDKTNARSLFRKVIERYPHSDQAEMAKKKIETIK